MLYGSYKQYLHFLQRLADHQRSPTKHKKKPASTFVETGLDLSGGGRGIRTHETFLPTGFQDQLHRPLGQASAEEFSGY